MKPYRNRKMLDAARDVPCIRCGRAGETRACHFNGLGQLQYGKGRGQKCSDLMTAEFCQACDSLFTEGSTHEFWHNKESRAGDFLHWIALTNIRRLERGIKF